MLQGHTLTKASIVLMEFPQQYPHPGCVMDIMNALTIVMRLATHVVSHYTIFKNILKWNSALAPTLSIGVGILTAVRKYVCLRICTWGGSIKVSHLPTWLISLINIQAFGILSML